MGVDFAIIGIENQDEIDYELPVRIMEYDVTRYRQQIAAINKAVRESPKNLSPVENIGTALKKILVCIQLRPLCCMPELKRGMDRKACAR